MTQLPIDLRTLAGKRYRLAYDESRQGRDDDPWLLTIPCRCGHIYPHSATLLGVATNSRATGLKLAKLPGVEIWQDGSDGMNLVFPAHVFDKVASVVRPKRKRQLGEEQRQRASAQGKANLANYRLAKAKCDSTRARSVQTASVDTLAV